MIRIDGFSIDATPSSSHQLTSLATEVPVEGGVTTDHIQSEPRVHAYTGVISDTPLGVLADERESSGITSPSRAGYDHLLSIQERRMPVTVEDEYGIWDSMAMISLVVTSSADTGDSLTFDVTFRQVEVRQAGLGKAEYRPTKKRATQAQRSRGARAAAAKQDTDRIAKKSEQFLNDMRRRSGLTHDPSIGTDLL